MCGLSVELGLEPGMTCSIESGRWWTYKGEYLGIHPHPNNHVSYAWVRLFSTGQVVTVNAVKHAGKHAYPVQVSASA